MKNFIPSLLLGCTFLLCASNVTALAERTGAPPDDCRRNCATTVSAQTHTHRIDAPRFIEILNNPAAPNTFAELLTGKTSETAIRNFQFQPFLNKSASSSGHFWMRFKIENKELSPVRFFLEYPDLVVDSVQLYDTSKGLEQVSLKQGLLIPVESRAFNFRRYVFPLELAAAETRTYYIRVDNSFNVSPSLDVHSEKEFTSILKSSNLCFGIFFGVILAMLLTNTFLYATFREKTFLWYLLSQFFLQLVFTASLHNFTLEMFPQVPLTVNRALILLSAGAGILFTCFFGMSFLKITRQNKIIFPLLIAVSIAGVGTGLLTLVDVGLAVILLNTLGAITSIVLLCVALTRHYLGVVFAKYYIAATGVSLLSALIFVLTNIDLLPNFNFSRYSIQIGGALEAILLVFALGQHYNQEKNAAFEAQKNLTKTLNSSLLIEHILQHARSRLDAITQAVHFLHQQLPKLQGASVYAVLKEPLTLEGGLESLSGNPSGDSSKNGFFQVCTTLGSRSSVAPHFVPCSAADLPPLQGGGPEFQATHGMSYSKLLRLGAGGFAEGYLQLVSKNGFFFESHEMVFLSHVESALSRTLESLTDIEKLKNAYNIAAEAKQTQTEFLANVSHELRTPLTAIQGFSDLLVEDQFDPKVVQDYSSVISRNTSNLVRLVDDLLDMVKVESGQMQFEQLDVSIEELCLDVQRLFSPVVASKNVHFSINIDPNVKQSLRTDPTRLRQILFNMVGNSIKFTQVGGITLRVIQTQHVSGKGGVAFEVEDSGCGIETSKHQHIFKPFTQADSSTARKYGGTGLGLSLSKKLAQGLGGDIRLVSSELNKGSLFEVFVPY